MDDNTTAENKIIRDQIIRPSTLTLQQNADNQTTEIIDLCTPTMDTNSTASPSLTHVQQFPNLEHRFSILASFPFHQEQQQQGFPLFANIPSRQLSEKQLVFRQSNVHKPAFQIIDNDSTLPSFLREKHQLYFGDLMKRLKVDMAILDFNYTRLNQYIRKMSYER
ncbi:unnamed protein product, partial [Adineta steineri]